MTDFSSKVGTGSSLPLAATILGGVSMLAFPSARKRWIDSASFIRERPLTAFFAGAGIFAVSFVGSYFTTRLHYHMMVEGASRLEDDATGDEPLGV